MKEKTKNKIITFLFCIILIIVFTINIFSKDKTISVSERRKLKQLSSLLDASILDSNFTNKFEEYAVDQFPMRDFFKTVKSYVKLNIMLQKDNNKLVIKDDYIYSLDYPLNLNSIDNITSKITSLCEKYFNKNNNIYYSIIPDKNYFLSDDYIKIDYKKLEDLMKENLKNYQYINIIPLLNLDDYYKTDTHWKQENLEKIAKKIDIEINGKETIKAPFIQKKKGEFFGVYYNQLGIKTMPDEINYLTNEILENCNTYNYETNKFSKIYNEEKWISSLDKYDFFLSGATPMIKIDNPNSKNEKELIIFRDSFGSSLIPLLVEAYSKITVIDTRYILPDYLEKYIQIKNQDVLFLYSTLIINKSNSLK